MRERLNNCLQNLTKTNSQSATTPTTSVSDLQENICSYSKACAGSQEEGNSPGLSLSPSTSFSLSPCPIPGTNNNNIKKSQNREKGEEPGQQDMEDRTTMKQDWAGWWLHLRTASQPSQMSGDRHGNTSSEETSLMRAAGKRGTSISSRMSGDGKTSSEDTSLMPARRRRGISSKSPSPKRARRRESTPTRGTNRCNRTSSSGNSKT